ncbi:hypothetical protein KS2013_992 [Kangiella sediminilitoris]|uniref:Uncharacterized protein n=1 Tax=Kangiella sediminilitoris TaxID=1144748 RepID=A0A1B3BAB7_9GAMM|nr:hypothetical protein KS2013_992 [Kangiella sediminilitoris]
MSELISTASNPITVLPGQPIPYCLEQMQVRAYL